MFSQKVKLASAYSAVESDPSLSSDLSAFSTNASMGIQYYTSNWYVGMAIPDLFKSSADDVETISSRGIGFMVNGGYVVELPEAYIKPEATFALTPDAASKVNYSAGVMVGMPRLIAGGLRYNSAGSVDIIAEYEIKEKLRFRYVYRHEFGAVQNTGVGTQMFSFGMDLPTKKSPRSEAGALGYWF